MVPSENKKKNNALVRFSSAGIQMGIIIGLFTWLGVYLDEKYKNTTAYWTVGLSLLGVLVGLVIVIREVMRMQK
jgi:F0F1-type ATP synthase assembly protein I